MPVDRHYDPIARALGHLLISFNSVEIHLSILIAHLMGHDVLTAAAFNACQSFSQKINFLKSVTKRRIDDEALKSELLTIIKLANELNAKRNRFIHAHYERPMKVPKKRPLL